MWLESLETNTEPEKEPYSFEGRRWDSASVLLYDLWRRGLCAVVGEFHLCRARSFRPQSRHLNFGNCPHGPKPYPEG